MDRAKTEINDFDEILDVNFLRESANLVESRPDMGKTIPGTPFILLISNAYGHSE